MMFFNLYIKVFKLKIWICSFYVEALNACKAEILLAFAEFRSILKQVLAWPFKCRILDYRFSNLEVKGSGKKLRGVSDRI